MSSRKKSRQDQRTERRDTQHDQSEHSLGHGSLPSSPDDSDLAAAKLHVAADLYERLRARGLHDEDARDVVQEVLTRAIQYRSTFTSARALRRWAFVVARNLLYDRHQEQKRLVLGDPPPPESPDPADIVTERLFMEYVLRAGANLSQRDREAIASAVWSTRPKDVLEQRRFNVVLHRARLRLRRRIDGVLVGAWIRPKWADEPAQSAACLVSTAVLGAVVVLVGGSPSSTDVRTTASASISASRPAPALPVTRERPMAPPISPSPAGRHARQRSPNPPNGVMAPVATPELPPPPRRYEERHVTLSSPDGRFIDAGTYQNDKDAPLVCLHNIPALGTTCYELPAN
jgi:DNA-directed RNA polymerase specialized sigma24 family protein